MNDNDKTKMTSFRLRRSEREKLARLAALLGLSKTDALRMAVTEMLQRLEEKRDERGQ